MFGVNIDRFHFVFDFLFFSCTFSYIVHMCMFVCIWNFLFRNDDVYLSWMDRFYLSIYLIHTCLCLCVRVCVSAITDKTYSHSHFLHFAFIHDSFIFYWIFYSFTLSSFSCEKKRFFFLLVLETLFSFTHFISILYYYFGWCLKKWRKKNEMKIFSKKYTIVEHFIIHTHKYIAGKRTKWTRNGKLFSFWALFIIVVVVV